MMMFKTMHAAALVAMTIGLTTAAAHANNPVLSGSYGWEDGQATIFQSAGPLLDPTNVTHPEPVNSGDHALRFTREVDVPEAHVAFIENLQDGDVIEVSVYLYDDGETTGRSRPWAHYANSGDVASFRGSAGGPSQFTAGIGWQQMTHQWVFDSNPNHPDGPRDALVIQIRGYSQSGPSGDPKTGPTDHYADDITINVYCAGNPDLRISFPDGSFFDGPTPPGPECDPIPCDFTTDGDFDWEDGESTLLGTFGNIVNVQNVGPTNGIQPNSGERMLRMTQGSSSGVPEGYVAFIENLQDGDEVFASVFGYDDIQGVPRMRLWAHYAVSGNPGSFVGNIGGDSQEYTSGIGWEEMTDTWTFDSGNGARDALMIKVRLYTNEDDTDFFIDDAFIEVCAHHPNVTITFPDGVEPPPSGCDVPDLGPPSLAGTFGWEDAESTILGYDSGEQQNISAANVAAPEPVHSGDRSLRVTEAPHGSGTPQIFLAYIEHLQDGDVIHGRFHAFDDQPGGNPRVRIWGRRAYSGDVDSGGWSHGGNDTYTSGIGWEELCHTWTYNSGPQNTDALIIEARIYSADPNCSECSTDYYIDDMEVMLWANPNATITFADGEVLGEPPLICPADINGSGSVDIFDLFTVLGAWGTSDPDADINNDGIVDGLDLGILLASWGPCPKVYLRPAEQDVDIVVLTSQTRSGFDQHDIYVQLPDADDALVNVFDANLTFSAGFESGSYIAIGDEHPDVVIDPNFDDFAFFQGTGVGENAGWYNQNPPNNLGKAGSYPDNRVLVASFLTLPGETIEGTLSVTYNDADGRPIYGTAELDTAPKTCVGDLNGDSVVDVSDLLILLGAWGPNPGHVADLNGDGVVDVSDLLMLLGAWGACP